MRKCFICNEEIKNNDGHHIYNCAIKNNILLKKCDIKYKYIQFNFPEISNKITLLDEYILNLQSLPDLKRKYNIDYKSIIFLLEYFNIEKRGISESAIKISSEKYKITCNNKYGVNNVSQLYSTKSKVKKTCIERYGVDNIRKSKKFHEYINKIIIEKYGISKQQLHSKLSKVVWENISDERKTEWLNKSIHSDIAFKKNAGYSSSRLETKISKLLDDISVSYQQNFMIKYNGGKKRFFYDFILIDYDIIIEVNGDYWHANPEIYSENDIIHYIYGHINAKDIWNKDKFKKNIAENVGLKVIYIWEKEINNLKYDDVNLKKLILNKLELK